MKTTETKDAIMICFAFVLFHAVVFVESGILVTSPRLYRAGSTQELTVSLFSEPLPWIVNATLAYSNSIIDTDEGQFTSLSDGTLKLKIPRALIGQIQQQKVQSLEARLTINGGRLGGLRHDDFQSSKMITITIPKISLFIQTDKPIYKPGQTVNMRIIGTDENLRPLEGKISSLTVKNPNDVRLMQWDDLDFVVGIISLKFPLSSQPNLGDWKIEAVCKGENKKQTFKVDKYVLPKYEVTIKPPPFVARFGEKNITARICAKYTYGQPVKGKVFVSFSVKLSRRARESQTTVVDEINGCKDISVKPRLLGLSGQHGKRTVYTGHSPRPKLVIKATVRETATNVSLNATDAETEVFRTTTKLQFQTTTPKSFKRGMPFTGQVRATSIDGTPLEGVPVKITVKAKTFTSDCEWEGSSWSSTPACRQVFRGAYIVPADGIVNFVVPNASISRQTRFLKIKASYQTSSASFTVNKAWSSPSNSFVEMAKLTSPQVVGSTAKVTFTFTAKKETKDVTFHYQVFSRGKLVAHGRKLHVIDYEKNMTSTDYKMKSMFTSQGFLEFNVTHEMVPSCRILLFYVREDKETVAATMQFNTEATLENEVKIRFADTQRQPGEKTRLIIKAAKGSKVAITAVDRSVHLLEEGNELSEADAVEALGSQDVGPYGHDSCLPTRSGSSRRRRSGRWSYFYESYTHTWHQRQKDLDSSNAFKDSGVIYFSDLKIKTAKCRDFSYQYQRYRRRRRYRFDFLGFGYFGHFPFGRFSMFRTGRGNGIHSPSGGIGGGGPLPDMEAMEMRNYNNNGNAKQSATKRKPVNVLREFPETWLWTEQVVNDRSGKMVLSVKVPDTITSWVASAFAMSNSSGLGISKPTSLKVFQPFFVSLTLPYSVIRGEEVSVIATIFNYENKCLAIRLSLEDSFSYRITSVHSYDLCVCSNEAKSVHFGIVPKALGQVPLSLFAKDINNSSACSKDTAQMHLGVSDTVIRKLLVEPEGVRQEYTYSSFVCLKNPHNESPFKDDIEISLPDNVVPGSVNAIISTVGDLMGPTLKVDSLLRLPCGCGEQNMVNFAPSIYIMKYLSSVEQLSESIENKAKNIMRTGYQRELTYKRNDGSYSAFGKNDSEGNMWLTAFVLRSFAQAQPFIFVDPAELRSIQTWITGKQQSDGCFPKHGRLFNKLLKGGVTTEATLTAFVIVSLLESGMSPENEIIQAALNCLKSSFQSNLTDSYTLSLFAYTFTLAKDPQSSVLFASLKEKAIIEGRLMHWENAKEISNSRSKVSYSQAPATDIEMTSYALMTYVLLAEDDPSMIGEAMPIVRWLTKQRNALGGFTSTQDTCVALQALSKYATKAYSNVTSLTVQFGNKGEQFRHTFIITEENRMVSQRAEVPSSILPIKKLPFKVNGEGCALVQADVSYNIPDVTDEPAFGLNVTLQPSDDMFAPMATQSGELLCLPLEMFITAEFLKDGTSNMAVVDVKLVSGYQVDEDSLKKLLNVRSLGIKRYEMEGQHVILYLDEIDKVSFSFKIYQSAVVKKTKPAAVTVYDYYETDLSATKMYKITKDLCGPDEMP
ncbi:pregnancy zone protein-like isoform X2 [Acropora millepora]|uniref:pregnancy zone protein-like isoform X2 n=1 Tax=Acropora millepora TaxID=45264 RepID=UPI001CF0EC97|nr:pregnancy zone protein-like isoform X2 [Acropora millepora]